MFVASETMGILLGFSSNETEARNLDLALRLNVLAVLAAIVFVSAVLLGAF
jgi:hypothetical protein